MKSTALPASDALFGKTRQAVLALLFGNPDRSYYVREIVQSAGVGASQVQRELERLTLSGLVTRERRANQVFFRANPQASIFPELVGLVGKSFGIAAAVRNALAAVADRIRLAFVYGSVARNEHHASSDVDLLVVGDALLSDLDAALRDAEQRLSRTIAVTLLDPAEFRALRKRRDHFLRAVLAGPRIWVIGDDTVLAALDERRAR